VHLNNNNVAVDSQLTDEDGNFSFPNLLAGNYSVSVVRQNNWLQTLPDSTYEIMIESGGNFSVQHFGFFLPNTIALYSYSDTDAVFATSNDRAGKQWHLSFYSNAVTDSTLVGESSSDTLLIIENLTEGNYIAVESDSSTYNHIGIVASDSSFASSNALISLSVANGQTKNVSFINALKRDAVVIESYLDTDSNYTTTNDRNLKRWYLALYNGNNQLVSGADTTQLVVENLSPGTYYAAQVDSLRWKHLGYVFAMNDDMLFDDISTSRKTEVILSGGGNSALVQFVNSNADSVLAVNIYNGMGSWNKKNSWSLDRIPLSTDSVVIPKGKKVIIDTLVANNTIAAMNNLGTIRMATSETLHIMRDFKTSGTFTVDVDSTPTFDISGNVTIAGKFTAGLLNIVLNGSNPESLKTNGKTLYNLAIRSVENITNTTANIYLGSNLYISGILQLDGNINASGYTVSISNGEADGLSGDGRILNGVVGRAIVSESSDRYRFDNSNNAITLDGSAGQSGYVSLTHCKYFSRCIRTVCAAIQQFGG
jgi:hypothetical protein